MDVLDQLALGLGLATLAGLNLYLTVLVVGMAVRMDWLSLHAEFAQLSVLGETPVLAAAGVFFALEFFADKIPWVDSLWDTVHTVIRPLGGGLLGIAALGEVDPVLQVIIGLGAGGTTLIAHGAKAGTRLGINTSPEPLTNAAVSLAEDAVVLGGSMAAIHFPRTTAVFCLIFLATAVWLAPKMFRRLRAAHWFLWNRLASLFPGPRRGLERELAPREALQLGRHLETGPPLPVRWAVPVVTGARSGLRGLGGALHGRLVTLEGDSGHVYLVTRRSFRPITRRLPLAGACYLTRSALLSEELSLTWPERDAHLTLRLGKHHAHLLPELLADLRGRSDLREMVAEDGGGLLPQAAGAASG